MESGPLIEVEQNSGSLNRPESPKVRDESNMERAQAFIEQMNVIAHDSKVQQAMVLVLQYGSKPFLLLFMMWYWIGKNLYWLYKTAPGNIMQMIFGVGLCFFGGMYFTSIAAIEAARQFGGEQLWIELKICWKQGKLAYKAIQASELGGTAEPKEGQVDTSTMNWNQLLQHHAYVGMAAVKDPQRLSTAVQFCLSAWGAVILVLKVEFARTVALAIGIADVASLPMVRLLGPTLAVAMGEDLKHWVPTIIVTAVKMLAVILACFMQAFISAFYSGIRGGKMFAVGLIDLAGQYGLMDKLPDFLVEKPFDANKSNLDELIAIPLAAAGFYWQVTNGFRLDFPLNLIVLPLTVVEYILRWNVWT